jgi:Myb/SANT-like DNA-binding domain
MTIDDAWQKLSEKLAQRGQDFAPGVCKNKMKTLKKSYTKKKDNMGPGSSGAEAMFFEYYNEMDDIFKKSPAITPHHLEASLTNESANNSLLDDLRNDPDLDGFDFDTTPGNNKINILRVGILEIGLLVILQICGLKN